MADNQWYSGRLCRINNNCVDFKAEIEFDQYHRGIITVYGITSENIKKFEDHGDCSAVMLLENDEYFSIFDFYVKERKYSSGYEGDELVFGKIILTLVSSSVLKGTNWISPEQEFPEISMEITDGYELIGTCPYNLDVGYEAMILCKKIEIPIQMEIICVNTIIGELQFEALPKYHFCKNLFSLGFSHRIQFKPSRPIKIKELHSILQKITDFFSLLCGEIVSINKLSLIDNTDIMYNFIGYCNFPKEKLNVLDKKGIDSTGFKRIALFKITDFSDLEKSLNYWFEHYDCLYNAHQAYGRILLDEDMEVVTINKYLAAMQLIEGVSQAYADEEQEMLDFSIKKQAIISKLEDELDKELVEEGLQFSGITFRKGTIKYFFDGLNLLEPITKSAFNKRYKELINMIVNDRNFYTHSSRRIKAELSFDEAMNVAVLCKNLYRITMLEKIGISKSLLRYRTGHNRIFTNVLYNLLGIRIKIEGEMPRFDKEMSCFSDSK